VLHAQRAAEGADLDSLRSTWRYHAVVAAHRAVVQAARDRLLGDEDDLARRTRLLVLDRAWSQHLATLADLRDGIHLRAMARMNPWLSFNDDAEQHFAPLLAAAEREAGELLGRHPGAASPADLGLHRPSATWSYVVCDTALGDDLERVVRTLRRAVRPRHR
jgi:preprotein translocase subunit SecA